MKYLLVLAMAVLVAAKPLDDEWEQFKKVIKHHSSLSNMRFQLVRLHVLQNINDF
jgi:hypothetical protein